MTFEQLLKQAEDQANEHELVTLTTTHVRAYLDGTVLQSLDDSLDWAQGDVFTGEKEVSYILIKIVK
jgi:hypothetical protein